MMTFGGIDPDTTTTAIVVVDDGGEVQWARLARASGRLAKHRMDGMSAAILHSLQLAPKGRTATLYAVENQHIRPRDKRPNDILQLAVVAGMAHQAVMAVIGLVPHFPLPIEWKGTLTKEKHHRYLLSKISAESLARLEGACGKTKSAIKHLLDAYGLALWCRAQIRGSLT